MMAKEEHAAILLRVFGIFLVLTGLPIIVDLFRFGLDGEERRFWASESASVSGDDEIAREPEDDVGAAVSDTYHAVAVFPSFWSHVIAYFGGGAALILFPTRLARLVVLGLDGRTGDGGGR